ncbi:short transient receptor potential channel 4-like [Symsagittifera roscoffensis]|uniref:short transient receptor potential channel 4-like n=1 Tax=Symsagittifera roscoffensis TaxID=84072 RepID=UPI00307C3BFB
MPGDDTIDVDMGDVNGSDGASTPSPSPSPRPSDASSQPRGSVSGPSTSSAAAPSPATDVSAINIAQKFVEETSSQKPSGKTEFLQKVRQAILKRGEVDSLESRFTNACKQGDLKTVDEMLSKPGRRFDINHRNQRGFTALTYAIRNEQEDILTRLLQEKDINLSDSLHCAVKAGNQSAALSLLRRGADPNQIAKTAVYPKGSSPLLLACHRNDVDIIQLLLDYKSNKLEMPSIDGSSLAQSRYRLDLMRALTCPSYVVLTSEDPVMQAFEMSHMCRWLMAGEVEFAGEYSELEERCEKLAADLVNSVENSEDIMVLLSLKKKRNSNKTQVGEPLCRLHYALEHNHKLFVAHAHCQQALSDKFFQGFKNWRHKTSGEKLAISGLLFILSPVWLVVYGTLPPTRLDYYIEFPLMKAVANFACYVVFLTMLITMQINIQSDQSLQPQDAESEYQEILEQFQYGSSIEWQEVFVLLWIAGKIWIEVSELRVVGLKSYVRDYWHLMDFGMNSLFAVAFLTRFIDTYSDVAFVFEIAEKQPSIVYIYKVGNETRQSPESLERTPTFSWHLDNPLLVYQSVMGVGSLLAFLRIMWWFRASQQLGKLQMMLGASFEEIFKFSFLYILIYLAFAGAINAVIWRFLYLASLTCKVEDPVVPCDDELANRVSGTEFPFLTLFGCMYQLYWTIFGYSSIAYLDKIFDSWTLNELVSAALFIAYNFIAVVILLNVLIGMITKTLDNIESNIDIEWKFVRSQIYSRFIEAEECAPPPFNIFPTVRKLIKWSALFLYRVTKNQKYLIWAKPKQEAILKQRDALVARFPALLEEMRERYLRNMEKDDEEQLVTQDDIQNLKNDISSLRYELLDALSKNSARDRVRQAEATATQPVSTTREDRFLDVQQQDRALMTNLMGVLEINSRVLTRLLNEHNGLNIGGDIDIDTMFSS